jgi:3'-phosphoadenosine 5'-phosphosulfate (PAPS) 3'-phosphatase
VLWVVDPLDATVNYLYGLHDWAVSIAAEMNGEIVVGAVYVPNRGEMFSAIRGHGAWVRTDEDYWSPLRCRPGVPLEQALVGTGFGYLKERRTVQGEVVAAVLPNVRDIRRIGVASVDLCAVAAGRLDGFYDRGRRGRRRPRRPAGVQRDDGRGHPRPVRLPRGGTGQAQPGTRRLTPAAPAGTTCTRRVEHESVR